MFLAFIIELSQLNGFETDVEAEIISKGYSHKEDTSLNEYIMPKKYDSVNKDANLTNNIILPVSSEI